MTRKEYIMKRRKAEKRRRRKEAVKETMFGIVGAIGVVSAILWALGEPTETFGYNTEKGYVTHRTVDTTYFGEDEYVDTTGNIWGYEDDKEHFVGERVLLDISDNATPDIVYDDIISGVIEDNRNIFIAFIQDTCNECIEYIKGEMRK